jgi:hypothetical protein
MMGARIPDNNFTAIDLLRELECARENLENKHVNVVDALILFIENNVGEMRKKRKSKKKKRPIVVLQAYYQKPKG